MYYTQPCRDAFAEGTGIQWDIVCPTAPGGNVSNYLYITAMNRASLGVEAFVRYYGTDEPQFMIYDWSLDADLRLQRPVPFSTLSDYLHQSSANGNFYQSLSVMNMTFLNDSQTWTNQAWLFSHVNSRWELAYQRASYPATYALQHDEFIGSWGPIVETFQDSYTGTNPIGAINTKLAALINGQWGEWSSLGPADSTVRDDNKGFTQTMMDANSSWVVIS
jgi:hypothetical protein